MTTFQTLSSFEPQTIQTSEKYSVEDDQKESSKENGDVSKLIEFDYIKSTSFRVVYADGVWGGLTPRGLIAMSFFSERHPIPKKLVHEITDEGTLGKESSRESRAGIIREVDVEVLMDLAMAKSFRSWLDEKIKVGENPINPGEDKK